METILRRISYNGIIKRCKNTPTTTVNGLKKGIWWSWIAKWIEIAEGLLVINRHYSLTRKKEAPNQIYMASKAERNRRLIIRIPSSRTWALKWLVSNMTCNYSWKLLLWIWIRVLKSIPTKTNTCCCQPSNSTWGKILRSCWKLNGNISWMLIKSILKNKAASLRTVRLKPRKVKSSEHLKMIWFNNEVETRTRWWWMRILKALTSERNAAGIKEPSTFSTAIWISPRIA